MTTLALCPIWNGTQFFDSLGNPLSGGKIFTYEANSFSVQQTTYTTVEGTVENTNPIVLNSSGLINTDIWLTPGLAYNLVLTYPNGTDVIISVDNIIGIQAAATNNNLATAIWNPATGIPSYISTTSFALEGDQRTTFAIGNRVRFLTDFGYGYATIVNSTYSTSTVVTLINDTISLDSSLTTVDYSALSVNAKAVDAGAVTYTSSLPYSALGTVGNKINTVESTLTASINSVNTSLTELIKNNANVYVTSGTSSAYTFEPVVPTTGSRQQWTLYFHADSTGTPNLALGTIFSGPLRQYKSDGTTETAVVKAGQISQVAWAGSAFILLDPLPPATIDTTIPHGDILFTSNGSWTCPTNVTSAKVTAVGGGGGGGVGGGWSTMDGYGASFGGNGGTGGIGVKTIAVTPGTVYAISIGAGGAGAAFTGIGTGAPGASGGNTTFGASLVVGTGGAGGAAGGVDYNGANGANGYGSVATYGIYNARIMNGGNILGQNGTGGNPGAYPDQPVVNSTNGTPGCIIIEW